MMLLIYTFIPIDCIVCHLSHKKYLYFKQCVKSVVSDISYLNNNDNKIIESQRKCIVNDIINCLVMNNNCKNCYAKITKFYNTKFKTCYNTKTTNIGLD